MKRIIKLLIILGIFPSFLNAQVPVYKIEGPHDVYTGPYYIRVFVNYYDPVPGTQWTAGLDLNARTASILENLNNVYNPYHIYFVGSDGTCAAQFQVLTEPNLSFTHLHNNALDIFDRGKTTQPGGYADNVPGTYCEVSGSYGTLPGSQSEVMIHEVGHCLGLSHTFTGTNNYLDACDDTGGTCLSSGEVDCYCCGDYVCDTEPFFVSSIANNADCSLSPNPLNLSNNILRNYMSYMDNPRCRDMFTEGQVKRMWHYLAEAPVLQSIQLKPLVYPAASPSGTSGNIIVESGELVISSNLEMLPGTSILVKKGAKLRVAAKITGACGKMWQGIIVEGDSDQAQTPTTNQGQVTVIGGGIIEHAMCAIDVQNPLTPGTGGGIVKLWGTSQIRDNVIGVRFGQYPQINQSQFIGSVFSVTDAYRGGDIRPKLVELNAVAGIKIWYTKFIDQRSACTPSQRAIGINALNSGFFVSNASRFEHLFRGIYADKLDETSGSFSVTGSTFFRCYKGIMLNSTGSFEIVDNDFDVRQPEVCATNLVVKGVEIEGNTTGFIFSLNNFTGPNVETTDGTEPYIGLDCIALGDGTSNEIRKNTYAQLNVGNRAKGYNGYAQDGLVYLCNTNSDNQTDFKMVMAASVRESQGNINQLSNIISPAGNVFSGIALVDAFCSITNEGQNIDYYFNQNIETEDPGLPDITSNSCITGFAPVSLDMASGCTTVEPCFPCPPVKFDEKKEHFKSNKQQWQQLTTTGEPSSVTNASVIRDLRIAMNYDANRILAQYSLDTIQIKTDSIVTWLQAVQTYGTDLRLARHYFFTGNYQMFDALWAQIPVKYPQNDEQKEEFRSLEGIFTSLRNHLETGGRLDNLPNNTRQMLLSNTMHCNEPGFLSAALLRRNGIDIEVNCESASPRNMPIEMKAVTQPTDSVFKVFPNPANGQVRVSCPDCAQKSTLRIVDVRGILVKTLAPEENGKDIVFDTSDMPEGIYFVQWSCGDASKYTQLAIIR